ncbi:54S ribosomal protein L6, mitochondrial [Erysiphe neolycopersici]|uniref:54S ribosomal protein L6, mitochondrial n=1 Tax=Erysiphe neolycopersici TaxID=212602 RepID=A0A420HBP3_9PEZI|nr:54S ribosomal protein L6, mitochondrial [Erysiphe neolycopersici]
MRLTKISLRNGIVTGRQFLPLYDNIILRSAILQLYPTLVISPSSFKSHNCSTFSTSSNQFSYIGRAPISIPTEVKLALIPSARGRQTTASHGATHPKAEIEGPLGKLSLSIPSFVNIDYDEVARKLCVSVQDKESKIQRAMWGTTRAYLNNHILGVSEGHTAILRLVGVGYRATIETAAITMKPEFEGQQFVSLKVGYSHPIELPVPKGIKASVPQPTRILLQGPDKEMVSQLAAKIRMWRKPEPYKGKGIFVNGETIKLKSKKIK